MLFAAGMFTGVLVTVVVATVVAAVQADKRQPRKPVDINRRGGW